MPTAATNSSWRPRWTMCSSICWSRRWPSRASSSRRRRDSRRSLRSAARLACARTKLDIAQTRAAADQLRMRLSQLTGLPAASIRTSTETIPAMPGLPQDQDDLAGEALKNNPQIKLAEAVAQAKHFRAEAEHKQLYPSVDYAGQYALLSRFN